MKKKTTIAASLLLLLLLLPKSNGNLMNAIKSILSPFLQLWEGFSSTPYWDVKRWSWGYGTPALINGQLATDFHTKPTGTITRIRALDEMLKHTANDMYDLVSKITRPLRPNQWAALLSFSYNLGIGNALNLIENINNNDSKALQIQWNKYILVDGKINDRQIKRRAAEWALWIK